MQRRIGRYDILERLGAGGMAEVYKAVATGVGGFQKLVALKRILPALAADPRFIQNFIDEARIAAELAHPNIVGVLDFGRADGELYLTMELVEGLDLRGLLAAARAQGRPLPVPEVCRVIAELAAGLEYAHGKRGPGGEPLGIAHCDVSPSNVMISRDGAVKVLDFGVARANFVAALEQRRLRGKPRYMAPEQTRGEPATAAADVFALGILGWELATGRALFRGVDLRDTVRRVRTAEIPRLDEARPELPAALAHALHAALQRRVGDRCGAHDLVEAAQRHAGPARALAELVTALASPELQTPPPSLATRADGTARRPRLGELDDELTRADPDARDLVVELEDEPEAGDAAAVVTSAPTPPPPRRRATTAPPLGHAASWRRRAVIAALRLERPRAAAIAEAARRAVQRGASIWRQGEAALELAFGLEVAGDDELDAARRWARDVDEHLARDAPQIGVVCGVEVQLGTWPEEAAARASELARMATPGAPRVIADGDAHVGDEPAEVVATPCPPEVLTAIRQAQAAGALAWVRVPDHLAHAWADDAVAQAPGARVVACPPPHARRPFGLLTALGAVLGGPLRDATLALQVGGVLDANEIDARVEHHAHDLLERLWPERGAVVVLAGVGGADRASLRAIGRARHLATAGWRDDHTRTTALVLLGDIDDDQLPHEAGFALRPAVSTLAAAPPSPALPSATPAQRSIWCAIASALAASGGGLRRRLLLELVDVDAAALDAALGELTSAGVLHFRGGAVRVAAPAAIAELRDDALVPTLALRLATLLRARLRAGREESVEQLAQVTARAHSPDASRAWLDAARAHLSAGDARGAAACIDAAGEPPPADLDRTLRATLDARLMAAEGPAAASPHRTGAHQPTPSDRGLDGAWDRQAFAELAPYARALELIPDDRAQASWRLRLGYAALRTGDRSAAARHLQAALMTAEQHGDTVDECRASLGLTLVHAPREAPATVRATLDGLATRAAAMRGTGLVRQILEALAHLELELGNVDAAWRHTQRARRAAALDDGFSDQGAEATAARLHLALGQPEAALRSARAACADPPLSLLPHPRSAALVLAAQSAPADPQAESWLVEAQALADGTSVPVVRAEVLRVRARRLVDPAAAVALLREATALLTEDAAARFELAAELALRLAEAGERAEASARVTALLASFDPRVHRPLEAPLVLHTAGRAAAAAGEPDLAAALDARARQRHRAILLSLTEPAWRVSYATRLPPR